MGEMWTAMASLMGVVAFCQSLLSTIFPPELRFTFLKSLHRLSNYFSSYSYFDITESDGVNTNELYNAVQLYLSTYASSSANSRLSLSRAANASAVTFGLSNNDTLFDTFDGVPVQWEHIVTQRQPQSFSWRPLPDEKRGFVLRVNKSQSGRILDPYLNHIMDKSNEIRRRSEDRYLYTNPRGGSLDSSRPGHPWESVPFKHPSTFHTLAMDPHKKSEIMSDLREFAAGKAFYRKTGRAWKRGYLLYGPPGTGKSSLIAAMANFLSYDIYDLELTEVSSNSDLKKLLMKTTPKSIIVIEDIDCSINLTNRSNKKTFRSVRSVHYDFAPGGEGADDTRGTITLSGILNFTDGLWSCCGSERIFVFTTNHVEKLDPALLRSGRMDMHIFMSYCSLAAMRILIKNYLEKELAEVVEFATVVEAAEMTPADVSEVLIRYRRDKERAVRELLGEMKRRAEKNRAKENGKAGVKAEEEEEQEKRALEIHRERGSSEDQHEILEVEEEEEEDDNCKHDFKENMSKDKLS